MLIATIAKRFTFDAAHHLPNLPVTHKCYRMHGHTYTVEIVLTGPVDSITGFIADYQEIADAWKPLHDRLDHHTLNEVSGLEVPSTENLCVWIATRLNDVRTFLMHPRSDQSSTMLQRVRVRESSTTWCELEMHELWRTYPKTVRRPFSLPSAMPNADAEER